MINTKQKGIILTVLFFVITYLVLYIIGIALTPENKEIIQTYRTCSLSSVFSEEDNTLDVLVVGHSGVLYASSPMEMYDERGITAYNLAKTTQAPFEAYNTIVEVLKHQSPKVIVLNIDEFTYDKFDNLAKITGLDMLNKLFPVFNVHTRWRYLIDEEHIGRSLTKNFSCAYEIKPYTGNKVMQPTDKVHNIIKPWKKYLDKICDLCEEQGIGIVFVEYPTKTFWSQARSNGFSNYANERGITFIDFNLIEDEVGIDWQLHTCDKGDHMNCYGAKILSCYIANYVADTYNLPSHKGEEKYAIWDKELADYRAYYGDLVL